MGVKKVVHHAFKIGKRLICIEQIEITESSGRKDLAKSKDFLKVPSHLYSPGPLFHLILTFFSSPLPPLPIQTLSLSLSVSHWLECYQAPSNFNFWETYFSKPSTLKYKLRTKPKGIFIPMQLISLVIKGNVKFKNSCQSNVAVIIYWNGLVF